MFYKATLLNNSKDKSTADIVLYTSGGSVNISVHSQNTKMQRHLSTLLSQVYYTISPGRTSGSEALKCGLSVQPNTMEYFQILPEYLSWRGYFLEFVNQVHKSVDLIPEFLIFKSTEDTYTNQQGETIVKIVPQGYIAVNKNDGRTIAGGRYLNANITKEGAEWYLVENPYEGQADYQREEEHQGYEMGFSDYHPGTHNELYQTRLDEDDEDYFTLQDKFDPSEHGKSLADFYSYLFKDDGTPAEEGYVPKNLKPDHVIYSPVLGLAMDSKHFPPKNEVPNFYEYDWYCFPYLDEDEDTIAFMREELGDSPMYAHEAKNGIVELAAHLDTSDAFMLKLTPTGSAAQKDFAVIDIQINKPLVDTKLGLTYTNSLEYQTAVQYTRNVLDPIRAITNMEGEDGKRTVDVAQAKALSCKRDLRGSFAQLLVDPYDYQLPAIELMTNTSQYEFYNSNAPKGAHGHFVSAFYGFGKTMAVLAAEAVMRNRKHFKEGTQVTLITAPSKNTYVWQSEISKFRGESATVIDGSKGLRIQQWEELVDQANSGSLPHMVVVSSSKFRLIKNNKDEVEEDDDDSQEELAIDAKYMALLAMGGRTSDKKVKGGHICALVLDETGQYVNPYSARNRAVREVTEHMYYGKGLVWTLNGDLSGNSASDTISEVSFINQSVRQSYEQAVAEFTKPDKYRKYSNARNWYGEGLSSFMQKFGHMIYKLDGKTVAGEHYGLSYTPDLQTPLGKNWGSVYNQAFDKLENLLDNAKGGAGTRAMGILSILINASYGAVSPQRLLEYDLNTTSINDKVKELLDPELYRDYLDQVSLYRSRACDLNSVWGLTPKDRMKVQDRDAMYKEVLSEPSRHALEAAVASWDNPVLDTIIQEMRETIRGCKPRQVLKLGVAGFSKRAIQALYQRLTTETGFDTDKVLIQKFDGDTKGEAVKEQMLMHKEEEDRHCIALVTGAGLYGLSLPATRAWRFAVWNPAKGGQYEGRFHRNPYDLSEMTVVAPTGVSEYMRDIENTKSTIQDEAKKELLGLTDVDLEKDDFEGFKADRMTLSKLVDRLKVYRPKVLEQESGEIL